MTLFPGTGTPQDRRRSHSLAFGLAGIAVGAAVATLLLVNPLRLRTLDALRQRLLGAASPAPAAEEAKQLWTCSMHPQIIEDHPGTCPICGMTLVPTRRATPSPGDHAASAATPAAAKTGKRQILFYRNPMDPTITSPVPAKDEMGMDYVPVYADEAEAAARGGPTVTIDPAVVQNMNVLTQVVERGDLNREIRTVGYLEYDQQKMVTVTTKYPGWVEHVYVNYVGEPVRKGQPLFEI
jgi:Cu(I)/Ag(I) efflux system membrane fusion protein